MNGLMKFSVLVGAALLAATSVGVTTGEEPPKDTLQGSWNDHSGASVKSTGLPNGPVDWGPRAEDETAPPAEVPQTQPNQPGGDIPNWNLRPWPIPDGPRQQQQGKPRGGFAWGGGKNGGGYFGGKQGGSFYFGKTKPPQIQQSVYPRPGGSQANPSEAQLLERIRVLQQQNAYLRKVLEYFAGQQANSERDPGLMSGGVPLQ